MKIASTDASTPQAVERAVNAGSDEDGGPRYSAHFCLPRDRHNARGFGGKLYGVCTLVRVDFAETAVDETVEVDWDVEGRVLLTLTKVLPLQVSSSTKSDTTDITSSTDRRRLAIFNIYAVNGTTYDYRDPKTGAVIGTRHDRKRAFHSALLQHALELEAKGHDIVIIGDLNVSRSKIDSFPYLRTQEDHVGNRADFNAKFLSKSREEGGFAGLDAFRAIHGDTRRYTYFPRGKPFGSGCDRVDLSICSKRLAEGMVAPKMSSDKAENAGDLQRQPQADRSTAGDVSIKRGNIVDAGMLDSELERGPSDHVPIFVVLDIL